LGGLLLSSVLIGQLGLFRDRGGRIMTVEACRQRIANCLPLKLGGTTMRFHALWHKPRGCSTTRTAPYAFKPRQKCYSRRPFEEDATANDRIVTRAAGAPLGTIVRVWGILDEILEARQINQSCVLRDRRDGVCPVARFYGQRARDNSRLG